MLQRIVSEKQADWVKKWKREEMPQQEGGEKQVNWVKKWKREEKLQRAVGEKQADWVKKSKQEVGNKREGSVYRAQVLVA